MILQAQQSEIPSNPDWTAAAPPSRARAPRHASQFESPRPRSEPVDFL